MRWARWWRLYRPRHRDPNVENGRFGTSGPTVLALGDSFAYGFQSFKFADGLSLSAYNSEYLDMQIGEVAQARKGTLNGRKDPGPHCLATGIMIMHPTPFANSWLLLPFT